MGLVLGSVQALELAQGQASDSGPDLVCWVQELAMELG
jgi:hypothetical protein